MVTLSFSTIQVALPRAPSAWIVALLDEAPLWGIDTDNEIASFAAQLAHESLQFTILEENLNYSAQGLRKTWPKRFPSLALAQQYARNPQRLANFVYSNRLGNGPQDSGDGWRFRGRGPIQLTGRTNYVVCGAGIGVDLTEKPDMLCTPAIGIRSACWYWKNRGLDLLDDDGDVRAETRAVNGGTHGLAERQAYFNKLMGRA